MLVTAFGPQALAAAIVPAGSDALALPKGHPDPAESPRDAAVREVREETGLRGVVVGDLGTIDYWYYARSQKARVHKVVEFFLLMYRAGRPGRHDHEVERVLLVPVAELPERLTYPGDREIAQRALSALRGGAGYPAPAANDSPAPKP